MMEAVIYIRFVVTALYLAAAVAYIRLLNDKPATWPLPKRLLYAAIAAHSVEILTRGAEAGAAGGAPFVGLSGFISIFAFLVAAIFLFLARRYQVHTLGAFYLPIIGILQGTGAVTRTPITEIPKLKTGYLLVLHVVPSAIAYAAFAVGFVAAVAFLLLERQIKRKRFGRLMRGLPNLDLVETVNAQGVQIGLGLLVFGALVGIVMGYREWGDQYHWELKNWVTYLIIAVYALQVVLRRFFGFSGRRSVLLSVFGFGIVICGFTVINFYFSALHGVT